MNHPEPAADSPTPARTEIHPSAVVHPSAQLGSGVIVGPFAVIDAHVIVGDHCHIGPHAHLTGHTTLGRRNRVHSGAVIGDAPQDLKYTDAPTRLRIGDDNVVRENATVHRSNKLEEDTVVGDGNFFMVNCHIGHNCLIGSGNIIANGALIAGHVTLADRTFISGNCVIHQFCRVGRLAMMQGTAGISKDLPPFCIARGPNGMCGLNTVGLRRAGFNSDQRLNLRRLYHHLFRTRDRLRVALESARGAFTDPACVELMDFVAASRRGMVRDTGLSAEAED